jgi:hypothetical protein
MVLLRPCLERVLRGAFEYLRAIDLQINGLGLKPIDSRGSTSPHVAVVASLKTCGRAVEFLWGDLWKNTEFLASRPPKGRGKNRIGGGTFRPVRERKFKV